MKLLACLSKFLGCHDTTWMALKRKYNLKWTTGNGSLEIFERCYGIINDSNSLDTMLRWLRHIRQELPVQYSNVFMFCTLTGLRANECFEAIRLIKTPDAFERYYDPTGGLLRHYAFPNVFIRRTKAAYISLVTPEFLDIARNTMDQNVIT
jgi:hypothetical protein